MPASKESAGAATIKRSTEYVTVACRLPQGLKVDIQGFGILHLHGVHSPYARFGYGMTTVRRDLWERILTQYGEHKGKDRQGRDCIIPEALWLSNKVIFVADSASSVKAQAKEQAGVDVGFNAIDPKNPNLKVKNIQVEGSDDKGMGT